MGAVLAARHIVTDKPVALKWLRGALAHNPEWMQRFIREARAAGRVHHPNVVDIYDVDDHQGALFLVMERLHGRSLEELLEAGRIPWAEGVRLLLPAMKGVQAAHRQGVLHRDLKPGNIFLCEDDAGVSIGPKVLDFGISKILDPAEGDRDITETGVQLGTPSYMAPEQLTDAQGVDHRVDVYAFGVILYRVLAGRLPYAANSPSALAIKIATKEAPPLEALEPSVPSGVVAIVRRAMARDRAHRYQDMGELIRALELAGVGEVTPVAVSSLPEDTWPRRRRLRAYAPWLLVGAALSVLAFVVFRLLGQGSAERAQQSAEPRLTASTAIRSGAVSSRTDPIDPRREMDAGAHLPAAPRPPAAAQRPPLPAQASPKTSVRQRTGESVHGGPAAPLAPSTPGSIHLHADEF